MKKILISILILMCMQIQFCLASVLDECYKIYPYDADTLFMNALSAINSSNKFEISEIQSKNGYILFLSGSKYYLLTLTKRYQSQTEIKILPQNSDYSQGSTVARSIFALIDYNLKSQRMEPVK